jgi:hypothetical protein
MIVTVSVEELLLEFVSPAVCTVAVLLTLPEAELLTATTSGIVAADCPEAITLVLVHVTAWPDALQFHPVAVPETNVNCEASVSETVIVPVVPPVPTLLTAMLNCSFVPAAKFPVCDLTIERSGAAAAPNVTESVEELFAQLLSANAETLAVFVRVPVAEELTPTTRGIVGALDPGLIALLVVQVTVCAEFEQLQPLIVAETKVN